MGRASFNSWWSSINTVLSKYRTTAFINQLWMADWLRCLRCRVEWVGERMVSWMTLFYTHPPSFSLLLSFRMSYIVGGWVCGWVRTLGRRPRGIKTHPVRYIAQPTRFTVTHPIAGTIAATRRIQVVGASRMTKPR